MGFIAPIAIAAIAGASVYSSISEASAAKKMSKVSLPQPPPTPKVEDASKVATAQAAEKKKAISRSRSVYTSPLGVGGEADISRKYLLGQ